MLYLVSMLNPQRPDTTAHVRQWVAAQLMRSAISAILAGPALASAAVTYGAPGCEFIVTLPTSFHMRVVESAELGQMHLATFGGDGYRFRVLCGKNPLGMTADQDVKDFLLGMWQAERLSQPQFTSEPGKDGARVVVTVRATRPAKDDAQTDVYEERCAVGRGSYMCVSAFRNKSLPASPVTQPLLDSLRTARATSQGRWTLLGNESGFGELYIDSRSRHEESDHVTVTLLRNLQVPLQLSTHVVRSIQMQLSMACKSEPALLALDFLSFDEPMAGGSPLLYSGRAFDYSMVERSTLVGELLAKNCASKRT